MSNTLEKITLQLFVATKSLHALDNALQKRMREDQEKVHEIVQKQISYWELGVTGLCTTVGATSSLIGIQATQHKELCAGIATICTQTQNFAAGYFRQKNIEPEFKRSLLEKNTSMALEATRLLQQQKEQFLSLLQSMMQTAART